MRLAMMTAALLLLALAVAAMPSQADTIPVCVGGQGLCEEVVCISQDEYGCEGLGDYGRCAGVVGVGEACTPLAGE